MSNMHHALIQEGWEQVVPYADDPLKVGMISEMNAPNLFEGDYQKNDTSRVLEGLFQRANTKNRNGRIYPLHILERETNKLQKAIKEQNGVFGELDHPETITVQMQKACLRIDGNTISPSGVVEGKMTLLPTLPLGQWAIGCCDAKDGKVGVSSRGGGTLYKKASDVMVGEDFSLRTYDIVHDPSTHGAEPEVVQESLIREFQEWCHARPSTRKMNLAKLVDKYLFGDK
jgi:hypothetical protein